MFVKGEFNIEYNPTIEDSYSSEVTVDGKLIKMSIVDTAGQEEYISLREQYYIKGDGFVMVYSIDNKNSFHALKNHRDSILGLRTGKKTAMVIAGNKCDLEEQRAISTEEIKKLSDEWAIPFFETSAQNNTNVKQLFETIAKELLKCNQTAETAAPVAAAAAQPTAQAAAPPKKEKKGKCTLF
ncbi:hypothetical protein EIN_031890 [Entamoeba invadens IP1]|uniref:Uncharacterized protein n=1 Tax=Entamoeba invadens IP1 TaxID=370355 RepID=A0A0A1U1H2_ENTIV|nr:hypothetical protein EIN_031890 [Entamoeba invadens IP1]ELP86448.1 hypothetical protein EIN_031890 [Entamoeba invadens IP1]|eukprot:XP_004185794.1 hypothetical protein EIN_031890 [Entamoeba invadens IP1]